MKKLIIVRHGRKDGENISADQISELEQKGIPGLNELVAGKHVIIHLGSEYERTRQTIKAWEKFADSKELCKFRAYITSDKNFGNADMFTAFTSNPVIKTEAERSNWLNAFILHQPSFIMSVQSAMFSSLSNMFMNAYDDEIIVMAGHTPLIEWLVYLLDHKRKISRDTKLAELTGFIINQSCGEFEVAGTIGL